MRLSIGIWRKSLSNPAERLPEQLILVLASGISLAAVVLSRLGVGFDGALDVYRSRSPVLLRNALIYQAVAWPLTAAMMWVVSVIGGGARRLLPFVGSIGKARLPLLLVGFVGALLSHPDSDAGRPIDSWEVLRMVLTGPLFVLGVVWLYQGFRYASGLSGVRLPVSFVAALTLAVLAGEQMLRILA